MTNTKGRHGPCGVDKGLRKQGDGIGPPRRWHDTRDKGKDDKIKQGMTQYKGIKGRTEIVTRQVYHGPRVVKFISAKRNIFLVKNDFGTKTNKKNA